MKKIFIGLAIIGGLNFVSAQVNQAANTTLDSEKNFFYDASSFADIAAYGESVGKGLVFPRTDLTQFEFDTSGAFSLGNYYTCFDGMVVYNIKKGTTGNTLATQGKSVPVTEGFYYFSNPGINGEDDQCSVANGEWKKIGGGENAVVAGVNNGEFWTLKGNLNTDPVTEADITNVAQQDFTLKASAAGKDFFGTTDAKNVMFATGKEVNGQMKSIARLEIGEKTNQEVGAKNDFIFVLDVYGKARFRDGIVTSASTYPDYVFDNYFTGKSDVNPNYEFKKLDEVETFIKENNHLPGVTKIDDLAKTESGYEVDNTQLSIQTLEKVEELYLHVIEQQKEIQALKAEIAELKK